MWFNTWPLELEYLCSNPSSASHYLCDLRQVIQPLCGKVSFTINGLIVGPTLQSCEI